jgi:hypothetical protein
LQDHFQSKVDIASSSEEALEKVNTSSYDAIVAAYLITQRNGFRAPEGAAAFNMLISGFFANKDLPSFVSAYR